MNPASTIILMPKRKKRKRASSPFNSNKKTSGSSSSDSSDTDEDECNKENYNTKNSIPENISEVKQVELEEVKHLINNGIEDLDKKNLESPSKVFLTPDNSDEEIQITHETFNRNRETILESVFVPNPLYAGSDASSSRLSSSDILDDSFSGDFCNFSSAPSTPRLPSSECEFSYSDVELDEFVECSKKVRINLSKCRLNNPLESWNWMETKPLRIRMIKNQFKVKDTALKSTSSQELVSPSPESQIECITLDSESTQLNELKDVTNFELFDGKGYLQPIKAIEKKDDLFVNFSCLNKEYQDVGPLESFNKIYNKKHCSLSHYELKSSCGRSVVVRKQDFSKKYACFTKENVMIDPVPAKWNESNCYNKPSSKQYYKPTKTPKIKSEIASVETVLKSLGLEDVDVPLIVKLVPSLERFKREPEIIQRIVAFTKFCAERMERWKLKRLQLKDDGRDEIFVCKKFTNLARELDRGTQYFREELLDTLIKEKDQDEIMKIVLFKSCAYRLMNKVETFKDFGRIPGPKEFSEFCEFTSSVLDRGETVFTGVHQNMGFERYQDTVNFVKANLDKLCKQLRSATGLKAAFKEIKTIKNLGDFFSWQILCDLTEVNLISYSEDWACLGPGANKGLSFALRGKLNQSDGTKYLARVLSEADKSWQELNIPETIKIDAKLVEHALCEFSKYCRFASQGVGSRVYKSRSHLDNHRNCHVCKKSTNPTHNQDVARNVSCLFCNRPVHETCLKQTDDQEPAVTCQERDPVTCQEREWFNVEMDPLSYTCKDCFFVNTRKLNKVS